MNSLNMHLKQHEKLFSIKGEICENGKTCWIEFSAGETDVVVFFDNPMQLAVFCREHNFQLIDNSAKKEEGK